MKRRLMQLYSGLGIALAAMLLNTAPSCATPSLATAIKATYLYKLTPFVTWPNGDSITGPFTICVVGTDPFGAALDHALIGQTDGSRPFQVLRMDTISPQSTCDIAYLGGSASQSVASALHAVRNMPVLTVTDGGDSPGIIDFTVQDGRVRFRIDEDAAENNGLTISSKLLGLALSVKTAKGSMRP